MTLQTIAVVNDDTAFLQLMHHLLTDEGYNTVIHVVGNTAYQMVKERRPDLVILDIRMNDPESGWQVLDLMRLDPETVDIPVILCSADSAQLREKRDRLTQYNAVALEKPFDLNDLLKQVKAFVGPPAGSERDSPRE